VSRRARRRDDGLVVVEFALVFGLLVLVLALVWPLGQAFMQKLSIDRSLNDVIRYATATPNVASYDPDDPPGGRRPTCTQVEHEFFRSYGIANDSPGYTVDVPTCPSASAPGTTITVSVTKTVNLGPLGDLLNLAGITHSSDITVSAAASGREE
jgi:hypothetical protein